MKTFWIQIIGLTLLIFGGFYIYHDPNFLETFLPNKQPLKQTQIQVGSALVKIEIADTPQARAKGLGERESISSDSGMLFIFPESKKYQFWMKGMKFPLDIIFINNGSVVDFLKNVPSPVPNQKDSNLPRLQSTTAIDMVLEVNAGYIDANSINIGDSVSLIK